MFSRESPEPDKQLVSISSTIADTSFTLKWFSILDAKYVRFAASNEIV